MTPFPLPKDCAELMRRIRERLHDEGKTLADFSREIGKAGNYHQVYAWVIDEAVEPKTSAGLRLLHWLIISPANPISSRPVTTTAAKAKSKPSRKKVKP